MKMLGVLKMDSRGFSSYTGLEEAQKTIASKIGEIGSEKVKFDAAGGRVLAEDLVSEVDVPPFDRAAMDGFAVRAEDTFGAEEDDPNVLRKVGQVLAGDSPSVNVEKGQCVEISTGAPIPEGADAVVMVESTTSADGERIEVRRGVSPDENISEKGSELKEGKILIGPGRKITPQVHGAFLACGVEKVKVFARPQVGIISTGKELVEAGSELEIGQIYDVNGLTVTDAVASCGGDPTYLGVVEDSYPRL